MDETLLELLKAFRAVEVAEPEHDGERVELVANIKARVIEICAHRTTPASEAATDLKAAMRAAGILETAPAEAERILLRHFARADAAPVLRELALDDAHDPPPVIWLDENTDGTDAILSVGEVAIVASPGGVGKSTLTLSLAIAAVTPSKSAYTATCGLRIRHGPTVLISYEDSIGRIAARIKRMAPSFPKQVHVWTDAGPLFVSREHGGAGPAHAWRALWNRIATLSPSLVAIDPVSAALHGVSLNESGPVRAFMRALAIEALAVQCGVLLVAHDTKAARNSSREGDNPGAGAVAGSATWFDAARGVMYMIRTNTARHLMAVKSNYGRAGWSIALHERTNEAGEFAGFEVSNSTATGATPGTKVPGV